MGSEALAAAVLAGTVTAGEATLKVTVHAANTHCPPTWWP